MFLVVIEKQAIGHSKKGGKNNQYVRLSNN